MPASIFLGLRWVCILFFGPEQVWANDDGNVAEIHLGDFRILCKLIQERAQVSVDRGGKKRRGREGGRVEGE